MIQKSYDGKNALYIIPTPIGNMEDITFRALEILKSVDYIMAEDTRTTGILLKYFNISKKLISSHKFNEETAVKKTISLLEEGYNVAIVTDRGTPLISDPGYITVKEVTQKGYNVISLPGACAFVPALTSSGINTEKFLFYGFLNSKQSNALKELETLKKENFTIVLYESPHRLDKTLQNIYKILGNRQISISREITKLHEEVFRGTVLEAIEYYKNPKGEFVIVIESIEEKKEIDINKYINDVKELITFGMKEKDAIKYIANKNNISKNILYNSYQRGE